MLFMTKSQHRRNDLVQKMSSNISSETIETESPQAEIDELLTENQSKIRHAVFVIGILAGAIIILVAPMLFWLS